MTTQPANDIEAAVQRIMQKVLMHCGAYKRAFLSNAEEDNDAFIRADNDLYQSLRAELGRVPSGDVNVEPVGWLYDWTHSSALGRPDEEFTSFSKDEKQARNGVGNRNVRAVYLASQQAAQPVAVPGKRFTRDTFDAMAFFAAVHGCMAYRKINARQLSEETGISETTLSRMRVGDRACDAASLAALSAWAGINPANYCTTSPAPPLPQVAGKRAPLTEDQRKNITAMWSRQNRNYTAADIIDAVEAAHGIGPEQEGV
jgi:hypothetical protein